MKSRFQSAGIETGQQRAWVAAICTALIITMSLALFGSADVEESANSSYSIAAHHETSNSGASGVGRHTVFGVPVYDTLQGTGDRLPYQASWTQSVTWWLRFIIDWSVYGLFRALFFSIFGLWLCIRSLQSWAPSLKLQSLVGFGLLASSSFGLNLRQNEWSDHNVQVVGVCAVSLFLMHRRFHDQSFIDKSDRRSASTLCIAISLNGVVTGHPGFWPVAAATLLSVTGVFLTSGVFRSRVWSWVTSNRWQIGLVAASTLLTFAAVVQDLAAEREGQPFGAGRLARTQGLFSEYAFGSLYGWSFWGSVPQVVRQVLASLLGTTLMPFFVMFDGVLPQVFRASDFRELPRVEFSGALIVLAFIFGWRAMKNSPMRLLASRVFAAQAVAWLFVAGSAADELPAVLAASGAWMTLEVVLVFNVFVALLLLRNLPNAVRTPRLIAMVNLCLVGAWCLVQFGFLSLGSGMQLPKNHPSWFQNADVLAQTEWFSQQRQQSSRILIAASPSFYDFLPFVALGQPVVASADPKTRSSNQLQSNFAFNYSIDAPTFGNIDAEQIDRVLDFLQVRSLLVGLVSTERQDVRSDESDLIGRLGDSLEPSRRFSLSGRNFEVYERSGFSALIIAKESLSEIEVCPILQQHCPLLDDGVPIARSASPKLKMCVDTCFWRFSSPAIAADKALVLPVTYDNTLVVRDSNDTRLSAVNAGGFLGVFGAEGIPETTLIITLDPDFRMIARVVTSYVNLLMVLCLAVFMGYSKFVAPLRAKKQAQSSIEA